MTRTNAEWSETARWPGCARALFIVVIMSGIAAAEGAPNFNTIYSHNWSGYAAIAPSANDAFTDVIGSWVVPTVVPDPGGAQSTYSSFWVGLDGFADSTVEQIGIEAEVFNGTAQYYAWYEMYPALSRRIFSVKIQPGDTIDGEVAYQGFASPNYLFDLQISDVTTGQTANIMTSTTTDVNRSSAEWIAEAPSSLTSVLPLADFGNVTFTSAQATLDGTQTGTISAFTNSDIDLVPQSGLGATASRLDPTGSSFTVSVPEPSCLVWLCFAVFSNRRRS